MRMRVPAFTRKTAPTAEPVTLDAIKAHLRLTTDDEDGLLLAYAAAAREWVETYTGRALATQTWQIALPTWPRELWLPRAAPLQSVTFVKYYDAANVLQTWSASNYLVPAFQEPALWQVVAGIATPAVADRADAVQVEYVCGYAADACPEALRLAVLTLTAHFHEHREPVLIGSGSKEVEFAVTALCAPYRVWWQVPTWP